MWVWETAALLEGVGSCRLWGRGSSSRGRPSSCAADLGRQSPARMAPCSSHKNHLEYSAPLLMGAPASSPTKCRPHPVQPPLPRYLPPRPPGSTRPQSCAPDRGKGCGWSQAPCRGCEPRVRNAGVGRARERAQSAPAAAAHLRGRRLARAPPPARAPVARLRHALCEELSEGSKAHDADSQLLLFGELLPRAVLKVKRLRRVERAHAQRAAARARCGRGAGGWEGEARPAAARRDARVTAAVAAPDSRRAAPCAAATGCGIFGELVDLLVPCIRCGPGLQFHARCSDPGWWAPSCCAISTQSLQYKLLNELNDLLTQAQTAQAMILKCRGEVVSVLLDRDLSNDDHWLCIGRMRHRGRRVRAAVTTQLAVRRRRRVGRPDATLLARPPLKPLSRPNKAYWSSY